MQRLIEESGDESMLNSIALENPCVTPLDLHVRLENYLKESFASQKSKLSHYVEKVLPQAKSWIFGQIGRQGWWEDKWVVNDKRYGIRFRLSSLLHGQFQGIHKIGCHGPGNGGVFHLFGMPTAASGAIFGCPKFGPFLQAGG